jgi:CRP-like cAMP-binding protein
MLTRAPSQFTVKAASDVLLIRMSGERFHALVSQHPKIVAHLEELALHPTPRRLLLATDEQKES